MENCPGAEQRGKEVTWSSWKEVSRHGFTLKLQQRDSKVFPYPHLCLHLHTHRHRTAIVIHFHYFNRLDLITEMSIWSVFSPRDTTDQIGFNCNTPSYALQMNSMCIFLQIIAFFHAELLLHVTNFPQQVWLGRTVFDLYSCFHRMFVNQASCLSKSVV